MGPFELWARLSLAAVSLVVLIVGYVFYVRQQKGALGGGISRAKAAWLTFAVLYWLGVCPILALEPSMPNPWRMAFGLFTLSFWARGLAELYMLYVSKNWKPPYGVAHDLFCIVLLFATIALMRRSAPGTGWDTMGLLATVALLVSLCAETYYALEFHKLVAGQTTGEDGVWFADQEAPKFKQINRITALINVPLYAFLGVLLAAAFGVFA
jgi:hypothetical protein